MKMLHFLMAAMVLLCIGTSVQAQPISAEYIFLDPVEGTNPVGTYHTVTATVYDELMNPVEGVEVTFGVVTGPHGGTTGTDTTDANGQAMFTYMGTGVGTDEIEAFFTDDQGTTILSDPVTKDWIPVEIGDLVWEDLDGDGIQDAGEPGIPGVEVNLYDCNGNLLATTTTDANGYYSFTITPGDYYVEFVVPGGYLFSPQDQGADDTIDSDADPTTGQTVCTTLEPDENDLTWDAGMYQPASIGDRVWEDLDGDGVQDDGEPGIAGVTVELYDCVGNILATTTTDTNGMYQFTYLVPGEYYVKFIKLDGYEFAPRDTSTDDLDSDADTITGETGCRTLESGETDLDIDAGMDMPISIDIEKFTNGEDADTPTGPFILVGDPVEWKYVVTNIGNVPLGNIVVTDDQIGPITCPKTELAPGESMECFASGTAVPGQYENNATVDADVVDTGGVYIDVDIYDTDSNHYFGAVPSIDIEKSTNGEDADKPTGPYIPWNSKVTWTYNVTNTGNVNLTNVAVVDDVLGPIGTIPVLAPGESQELTAIGVAAIGQYENNATAVGTPPVGPDVGDYDPSHYLGYVADPDFEVPTAPPLLTVGVLGIALVLFMRRKQD